MLIADNILIIKSKLIPDIEHCAFGHCADAKLGALQISQNSNGTIKLFRDITDMIIGIFMHILRAMTKI